MVPGSRIKENKKERRQDREERNGLMVSAVFYHLIRVFYLSVIILPGNSITPDYAVNSNLVWIFWNKFGG